MYIDKAKVTQKNGKISYRYLLRQNYRQNGKVKHRTLGNLTRCSVEEIDAIRAALKNKDNLSALKAVKEKIMVKSKQGLSIGTIVLLKTIAERINITKVLGNSRQGKLALWQIMARIINQGSRLSAVRLANGHAICDLINMDSFDEDDLYENLDWLCDNQREMEKKLFRLRYSDKSNPKLYLYDVTSSYFEGTKNELGDWGYNRDKKKGKMQIVIGLLTDEQGDPVSVEVFKGNTNDIKTFANQIKRVAEDFGIKDVTMVGDRGMIKSGQVKDLKDRDFHYITALTKPQIEKLINKKIIKMDLFDEKLCEVEYNKIRYVLRRNPYRVEEIETNRLGKLRKLQKKIAYENKYLKEHLRASVDVACRKIKSFIKKVKLNNFVTIDLYDRTLSFSVDEGKKKESTFLDGCYVIKTDLNKEHASTETVHQRYKDLAMVEEGFRTMKTGLLETRPVFVRKEKRTRGHVFVVMLAYCITRQLKYLWKDIEMTVKEGIDELNTISSVNINVKGVSCWQIPEPRNSGQMLLDAAGVVLPEVLPNRGIIVATKKKLVTERK